MYVIVTTNRNLADEAKRLGADVFTVSQENQHIYRAPVEKSCKKTQVIEVLRQLAFKPNLKGYEYMKYIMEKCANDPTYHYKSVTKEIYPECAAHFGTTVSRVERTLRHSIERSFEQAPERYNDMFQQNLHQSPTNSQFISMMSEYFAYPVV